MLTLPLMSMVGSSKTPCVAANSANDKVKALKVTDVVVAL